MLTTGAPHSSTAATPCSTVRARLSTWGGYWILPHPAQARIQRSSGYSISTKGRHSRLAKRCLWT